MRIFPHVSIVSIPEHGGGGSVGRITAFGLLRALGKSDLRDLDTTAVIPAEAEIQTRVNMPCSWGPACAGTTTVMESPG